MPGFPGVRDSKSTLDWLGTIGSTDRGDDVKLNNTAKALISLAEYLIAQATRNLERKGNVATGRTAASMTIVNLETQGTKMSLDVEILSTYKFLDQGVNGTNKKRGSRFSFKTPYANKKMATAILKWLRKRSVVTKYAPISSSHLNIKGKEAGAVERKSQRIKKQVNSADNFKKLAYAVASSIKQAGIEKTLFFTNAVRDTKALQKKKFAEAFKLDIIESLNFN